MKIHTGDAIWDRSFSLLGHDAQTGETVWMKQNDDGSMTIRHDQPIDALLNANVEAEKLTHGKRFGDWNRFASVPDAVMISSGLDEAHKQKDKKFMKRFFNDPDNRKFRTSRGRV